MNIQQKIYKLNILFVTNLFIVSISYLAIKNISKLIKVAFKLI